MTMLEFIKKNNQIDKSMEELIRMECPDKYLEDSAVQKKIEDRCPFINCFECWNTSIKRYGIEE